MSSTDVRDAPAPQPGSDGDETDAKISRSIMALLGYHGLKPPEISKRIDGLKQATLYTRLNGERSWEAKEVAVIARLFGLPVGQLFEGRPQLDDSHLAEGTLRFSRISEPAGGVPENGRFSGSDVENLCAAYTTAA